MPRRPKGVPPPYKLHATGQAYSFWNGCHYFGVHGSPESQRRYRAFLREWEAAQVGPVALPRSRCTVADLAASFLARARTRHRRDDGRPTSEFAHFRIAFRPLLRQYGEWRVEDFGPADLKALQAAWRAAGLARSTVNAQTARVKRLFKWGVKESAVPPEVLTALLCVDDLEPGDAPEHPPVPAAPWADVEATLPHLNSRLQVMVRLQWEAGMRPDEVCAMRGREINRDGLATWKGRTFQAGEGLWTFQPGQHKNKRRGKFLAYVLNARAQALLAPWLRDDPDEYLFQPREAVAERRAAMRAARKTPVQPSQQNRAKPGERRPGQRYHESSYAHAVAKACAKAGVKPWTPLTLRHAWFTRVESTPGLGIADASKAGGHASISTTLIYVEESLRRAAEVARRLQN